MGRGSVKTMLNVKRWSATNRRFLRQEVERSVSLALNRHPETLGCSIGERSEN